MSAAMVVLRRAGVAAMLAGTVLGQAAEGASTPTLRVTTTTAGSVLAQPTATGTWSESNGVWSADIKSVAPPASVTRIEATWTSPNMTIKHRSTYFASMIDVAHQGQTDGALSYFLRARTCVKRWCEPWTVFTDQTPNQYVEA